MVPGAHLDTRLPGDEMLDTSATHPQEKILLGEAGDVVIFNSHTWHGGTLNRTNRPRRALHAYYTRHHHPAQLDQQRYLRPETALKLNEAQLEVLGVNGE